MTDPVRIGFIGTGGIANHHLKQLATLGAERVAIAALCDVAEDRARAAAAEHGGRVFADHRWMLDEMGDGLDAVYVCVPPFAHDDAERNAAAAGLHLFVEKPVVLDLELGLANLEAFRAAGVLTSVGYTLRHVHPWRTAHDLLAGRPVGLICADRWGGMPGDESHWWRAMDKSGGQMHEQTTHQIDAMRWLAGDVARVHALHGRRLMAGVPGLTIPDAQVYALEFVSGAVGYASTSCALTKGGGRNAMQVVLRDVVVDVGRELVVRPEGAIEVPAEAPVYESIDAAFVRAVATGDASPILCDYEEGLKSAAVSLAGNESAATGRPVDVWRG